MATETRRLRIGPGVKDWPHAAPKTGCCQDCGEDCDGDECGLHAAGCIFGGFTRQTAYWLIAEGCPLYHGEREA